MRYSAQEEIRLVIALGLLYGDYQSPKQPSAPQICEPE
jgi:hypothetical protein